MKMIGLIGGMSWESTLLYYRIMNNEVAKAKGKLHSARLMLYSFDFEEIVVLQKIGAWEEAAQKLGAAGRALKTGGCEALVICTNTMHKVAADVERISGLPVIHIADCTGEEIIAQKISKVGLMGTKFTMEQPFYKQRLEDKYGIEVLVPNMEERRLVHMVIFDELCKGIINPRSKEAYQYVISRLKARGAEAVILGCTEICLLLNDDVCEGMPLFNTTLIHAQRAAQYAMERQELLEAV